VAVADHSSSWLFTTSLVLAVGILGHSGLIFEKDCQASIRCLEYFAMVDPHARQYLVTVQSLLKTTTTHVKKRELKLRSQQKQASSQLFGLLPSDTTTPLLQVEPGRRHSIAEPFSSSIPAEEIPSTTHAPHDWTIYDADFFALPWLNESDQGLQDFLQPGTHTGASIADIPLFPMYNQQTGSGFH
jgi:hypothetical protein